MAFGAGTHWEFNTGGSNNNGGGFDTGNASMPTDLACTLGTGNAPVVTSASYAFVAGDVNKKLFIKAGTNWYPGWYNIDSVDTSGGTSATLNATIGAAEKFPYPYGANTVAGCASVATQNANFGTWAIDYSRSTTVKQPYTDAVVQVTTTQLVSVGRAFTVADVGNIFNVTSGGTVQRAQVLSVAAGVATMDKSMGTATNICVGNYGGVLALPTDALLELSIAGNTWWLKENGDSATVYTTGAAISISANGTTSAMIRFKAYRTCRGELITGTTRPTIAAAANTITFGQCWILENIIFTLTVAGGVTTGNTSSFIINCKVTSLNTVGTNQAFALGQFGKIIKSEGVNLAGIALTLTGNNIIDFCYFHDSGTGISYGSPSIVINSIIAYCGTALALGTADNAFVAWNTFYGFPVYQGTGISGTTSSENVFRGNIITGFTNGINITTTYDDQYSNYNNYYNNGTDVTGVIKGLNDIALDPAFVNPSGNVGSELCTNGVDWTGGPPPSGWATVTAGTIAATAGGQAGNYCQIKHDGTHNNPEISYSFSTTIGHTYRISFYAQKGTATNLTARIGTTSGGSEIYSFAFTSADWNTQRSYVFVATATTTYFSAKATTSTSAQYAMLDTVSIYEHSVDFTPGSSCQLTIDWSNMGC